WAYNLKEYAYSSNIQDAKHYWLTEYCEITPVVPVDFPNGRNEEKYTDQVTVTFTEKETQKLLKEMNKTYRVNVDEVLLTALVLSVTDWMGENQIAVNLEGHGREEIAQDIDLTRTVGWFTSLYPVLLNKAEGLENTLQNV